MIILDTDINIVWAILIFFTIFMIVYNAIISFGEPHLPSFILELFRYGKTLDGPVKTSMIKMISVNKSCFTHFYIFSSIYVPVVLATVVYSYTTKQVPELVSSSLDVVCTQDRPEAASPARLVLVLVLLTVQVFRRLYECVFVNQPSSSTMNITHYIVGYAHYFCAATGYVCEAPSFGAADLNLASLGLDCWALVAVFFAAWYYEFEAHKIFADLKKTRPGTHSIPSGSLFELVSCPHYLCEVLIYTCFTLLLTPAHQTGVLVWVWVTTNQMIAATMSHNWYKRKFKEYPPNRKAIIPFLL